MIAGALATLLASGAYFAADSIKTNANIYRNANRMDDEGVFWLTNPEVERMLQHDIRSLWETGKRDFIPEELEGFFEENNSAREAYFDALAAQCMLENGCKPMEAWGSFNRHTYNCFLQYNRSHGAYANEWLRIHKPEIILARIEKAKEAKEGIVDIMRRAVARYDRKFIPVWVVSGLIFVWGIVRMANGGDYGLRKIILACLIAGIHLIIWAVNRNYLISGSWDNVPTAKNKHTGQI